MIKVYSILTTLGEELHKLQATKLYNRYALQRFNHSTDYYAKTVGNVILHVQLVIVEFKALPFKLYIK